MGPDETALGRSIILSLGLGGFLAILYRWTDYLILPERQAADAIWLLFLFTVYPVSQTGKPGYTAVATLVAGAIMFFAEGLPIAGRPSVAPQEMVVQWLWLGALTFVLYGLMRAVRDRVANVPLIVDLLGRANELRSLPADRTILDVLVRRISEAYAYPHVNVFRLQRDGRLQCVAASSDAGAELVERSFTLPAGVGIIGEVMATGRPHRASNVAHCRYYHPLDAFPDTRAEIVIPIIVRGRTIGVLDAQCTAPYPFQDLDEELLGLVTQHIGKALDNAELVRRMHTIIDAVTYKVLTPGELYPTLQAIVTVGHDHLDADIAILFARDPGSGMLYGPLVAGEYDQPPVPGRFVPAPDTLLGHLLDRPPANYLDGDVERPSEPEVFRGSTFARSNGVRSRATLLLHSAGDCVGVLFLNYRHPHAFDAEDEGTFSALARLASLAISKAQLQERRVRLAGHILSRSVHENVKGRSFAVSELLARVYDALPPRVSQDIRQQIELAHDWVRTMQKDAAFFGSAWFEPPNFDLRETVEKLAHDFQVAYELPVTVRYEGRDPSIVPPGRIERVHALLFEAINNAGRHGGTLTRVELDVIVRDDHLALIVEDDGVGIDPSRRHVGMGTLILRELAEEAGGTVVVERRESRGTRVRIELPFGGGPE